MTDREERQHVIEVLKQMRLDYEDFWEENDTEEIKAFNYAIASIETDLKYDLLYEETSGQADKPTTKDNLGVDYLGVDCISREQALRELKESAEHHANDSREETLLRRDRDIIRALPSVTPQFSSELDKNSKKLEKDFGESDCIPREQAKTAIRDRFKDLPSRVEINTILNELPSVTPQEPRKGHWIEHPRTKELRFHHIYECSACKTQIIGNRYNVGNYKYCPHCGIEFEVEG